MYIILDQRLEVQLSPGQVWLSVSKAENQITEWQNKHARGSRRFSDRQLRECEILPFEAKYALP